jgi:hypothetical protein
VIAVLLTPLDVRAVKQLGIPAVTFAGALENPGVPRVMANNAEWAGWRPSIC